MESCKTQTQSRKTQQTECRTSSERIHLVLQKVTEEQWISENMLTFHENKANN